MVAVSNLINGRHWARTEENRYQDHNMSELSTRACHEVTDINEGSRKHRDANLNS